MEKLFNQIQNELAGLSDPDDAVFLQGYFKTGPGQYGEGDIFRGIRVPVLHKLSWKYRGVSLDTADLLLRSAYHEDRLLALLILIHKYASADETARKPIYKLYLNRTGYINNWDLVDLSAFRIVGAHLKDRSRRPLYTLALSKSLWERRISVLATFYYIRDYDFEDSLNIAALLLNDNEDLIHKAVGWMLREIGKRDLAVEEEFLRKHYRQMPRTMLRYAIERFLRDTRLAYLNGKI